MTIKTSDLVTRLLPATDSSGGTCACADTSAPPRPSRSSRHRGIDPKVEILLGPLGHRPPTHRPSNALRPRTTLPAPAKMPQPSARSEPLQPHEVQQAAYLLGRKADARPIEDAQQVRRLVDANATVHGTRRALGYGRGNLKPDNLVTGGVSQKATHASYLIGAKNGHADLAATALALGVGNCDQHGALNTLRHGAALKGEETVYEVGVPGHTFAELHTPGQPVVTMDSWANGPAVEVQDACFGKGTLRTGPIDARSGPLVAQAIEQLAADYQKVDGPRGRQLVAALLEADTTTMPPPSYGASNQVVDSNFAERVRSALRQKARLQNDVIATVVAKEAYDVPIREAARAAPAIRQAAARLDALERPPVEPIPDPM
jgi:hypothetical protein